MCRRPCRLCLSGYVFLVSSLLETLMANPNHIFQDRWKTMKDPMHVSMSSQFHESDPQKKVVTDDSRSITTLNV